MTSLTRRNFLANAALSSASIAMPRLLLAEANTTLNSDARFVFVILRGALDGLAAVPAYGDGNYARMRGELALSAPDSAAGALKLDGMFALHPALSKLHQRYSVGELAVFHAVASPYRDRSHFDAQDLLENGTRKPHGANDGWLNRALATLRPSRVDSDKYAMAFAQNIPLVLQGSTRVGSWAPSRMPDADADTLQRLADLYASDEYFAKRLQTALAADSMAASGSMDTDMQGGRRDPLGGIATIARAAGRMMQGKDGARVAVIETNGWDTHANQGAERGLLATRLTALDNALDALRVELGAAWKTTAVLIATEFGRTVAVNGTRGTDHGTATCAFLVGGAVRGGRVVADWPGLATSNLYQGRDLKPTLDLRSVCKGVLAELFAVNEAHLESKVFPDSREAKPMTALIRKA
ncbi:MAG: DUF1501 domain-containing protein [Candidatus Obscuribacterales bacterium]|nr:DUF1501 domain-containing protein [Steroidobacteraceae bacterium]